MAAEEGSVPPSSPNAMNEWVKLNIGGTLFSTTKATLCKEESFLSRLCKDDPGLPSLKDENGAYMVDRDPRYFYPVLNYLRHGKLIVEANLTMEGILEEAEFYNLSSLVKLAQQEKLKPPASQIFPEQKQVYRVLHCQEGELTQLLGTLSDGWKLAQLVNIGSQYSYSSEDQSEFLVVVSKSFDDIPRQETKPTNKEKVLTEHGLRM